MRAAVIAFARERMRLGYEIDVDAMLTHAGVKLGFRAHWLPCSKACHRDAWAFFDWCRS